MARYPSINVMRGCHEARIYLAGSDARAGDFCAGCQAVLQIASGTLSNQQILEEKTVAGWVAENQTALLYLMTREQRAVRHQGESDMAGSRWYWRTIPLNTGNVLLQAVDIEVSLHDDFSPVIQSRRAWFSAVGGQQ